MQATLPDRTADTARYARTIEASKRARWDIDRDVIRGRAFERDAKFLPDGLSRVDRLAFLAPSERRFLSRVQGRTYAALFGVIERAVAAKMIEQTGDHRLGDQVALEALVRFVDEELKHQELFRRIERLAGESMPEGWSCVVTGDDVARVVLSKSTWGVLALVCHIEHFTQAHYKQSIEPDAELSELFRDVFRFHWMEESQHAVIDELEWQRVDAGLDAAGRERGVEDLIALVSAVDGILQAQAAADAAYFARHVGRELGAQREREVAAVVLAAYRWQYLVSGMGGRFADLLGRLIDGTQAERVQGALAGLVAAAA